MCAGQLTARYGTVLTSNVLDLLPRLRKTHADALSAFLTLLPHYNNGNATAFEGSVMSFDAISWAMAQPINKSSAKFTLVALANCVNNGLPEMLCWPSISHLAEITAQNRKTVLAGIKKLCDLGYLNDTGQRCGKTKQVIIYRLNSTKNGAVKDDDFVAKLNVTALSNNPEIGIVPIETVPFLPTNSTVSDCEQSQKRDTEPVIEPGTEPVTKKEKKSAYAPPLPEALLNDFLCVRKAKRAGPVTPTVIAGLQREADKAEISLIDAVTACCEYGWQGFSAEWYAQRTARKQNATSTRQTQSFRERDECARHKAYEEMTGRKWPSESAHGLVITDIVSDVTPKKVSL